jgi:hypothetical protein
MVVGCKTHAEASEELHRQITERFGSNPDVLDSLTIQVLPCPHEVGDRKGKVLVAYPTAIGANSPQTISVYFGDDVG